MSKPRRTAAEMYPLLKLYAKRTQSAADFCAEHGVSSWQLSDWRRKQREASASGEAFVEITPDGAQSPVEVNYPNGVRVRFTAPPAAAYLAQLVQS